ncbi:hypothetical protein GUJ93_ZPchr0011g28702 [Zizania palustris]|uniref:Phytosulfokine n=1 Tax=Zizania palustris TaxID=103762 RepID=A0A8J5WFH3_ZIZPA|nr:hypothetical protein GUJ93_ZPchr0011g28702 [Zizania palustris]
MRAHGVSSCSSSRLAALALLLVLVACFFFHSGAAAARPLPAAALDLPRARQENDGVKTAADGPVLQQGSTGNGHEVAELMGAAAEEVEDCEEGNDDECVQRRLLRDAHLDYIYTQHNGRP